MNSFDLYTKQQKAIVSKANNVFFDKFNMHLKENFDNLEHETGVKEKNMDEFNYKMFVQDLKNIPTGISRVVRERHQKGVTKFCQEEFEQLALSVKEKLGKEQQEFEEKVS